LPVLRRVIGATDDPELSELLGILTRWERAGAHRRDLTRDNVYEDSAAVALMDAWWEPLVQAMFEPTLGDPLIDRITPLNRFNLPPMGNRGGAFDEGWYEYVDKDLRTMLGDRVRGRFSRRYCGGGSLTRCRSVLVSTLKRAAADVRARYGVADLSQVRVPATCEERENADDPVKCDQIEFQAAGAITTPPIPWQDRPTFQQVLEVRGHRTRPAQRPRRRAPAFTGRLR
jgi:hypothetical protein